MPLVSAIVLAAGRSSRLGFPKQLVKFGGEALLERTVRIAFEAGLDPVYGVISADLVFETAPPGMIPCVNHQAAEGMASSIRCGLRRLLDTNPAARGVIILACDQPTVTAEHLLRLSEGNLGAQASAYAGRKGIPAYFPAALFADLLHLTGDTGARELLNTAEAISLLGGELDIDTIEDLERMRSLEP